MTKPSDHEDYGKQGPRKKGGRRSCPLKWRAAMALMGLVVLAAGCGGSNGPAIAGSGSNTGHRTPVSTNSSSTVMAQMLAYAGCMRGHGISDFPDPTPSPGGGAGFQIDGGPGSNLDHNNPRFEAADQACRSLLPYMSR